MRAREPDATRRDFLRALITCCEAAIAFAGRYADEADRLAQQETDPARRVELEKIAAYLPPGAGGTGRDLPGSAPIALVRPHAGHGRRVLPGARPLARPHRPVPLPLLPGGHRERRARPRTGPGTPPVPLDQAQLRLRLPGPDRQPGDQLRLRATDHAGRHQRRRQRRQQRPHLADARRHRGDEPAGAQAQRPPAREDAGGPAAPCRRADRPRPGLALPAQLRRGVDPRPGLAGAPRRPALGLRAGRLPGEHPPGLRPLRHRRRQPEPGQGGRTHAQRRRRHGDRPAPGPAHRRPARVPGLPVVPGRLQATTHGAARTAHRLQQPGGRPARRVRARRRT